MTVDRSHLSIGEVLALLQGEFPDVTISKIRFLESQGLLVPERTPSGYRKFHDEDIERLRWILTQQRDHFLPLKVIKERIESGDLGSGPPEGVLPFTRDGAPDSTTAPSDGTDGPVAEGAGETPTPTSTAPIATGSTDSDTDTDSGPSSRATDRTAATSSDRTVSTSTGSPAKKASGGKDMSSGGGGASDSKDRASAVGSLLEGPAPEKPKRSRRRHPTGHVKGEPTPAPGDGADETVAVEELALTRAELAEQSGLSAREIDELERFGLLAARPLGDSSYFDEDALAIARLAGGFSRYGIEPRHLRMYKVSAEREAGMFEQLIMPLLKQRRAAARDEAVEMLEELSELADDLRAVMVRGALREYLRGA